MTDASRVAHLAETSVFPHRQKLPVILGELDVTLPVVVILSVATRLHERKQLLRLLFRLIRSCQRDLRA